MPDLLERIAKCIEIGKIDAASPYPPELQGEPGADELTAMAIDTGVAPHEILAKALVVGMRNIGDKFGRNEVFLPDVLMAQKAMEAATKHLKPFFKSGEVRKRGTFILGTVAGDLHDIGKKIVGLFIEGGGWEVIDLGVDVPAERFVRAVEQYRECTVGLSTLLTTTMVNMQEIVTTIKSAHPRTTVIVGGAPITQRFAESIGADAYSPDPQGAVNYLNSLLL
jgi:5-methyltetrahydrofolate--homocysteine methyltransferase